MSDNFDLFAPPSVGVDTSEEAADAILPLVDKLRRRILAFIIGTGGATCDEIEASLDYKHQTASAALWALEGIGMIEKTTTKRRTRSNRNARVYIATPLGLRTFNGVAVVPEKPAAPRTSMDPALDGEMRRRRR